MLRSCVQTVTRLPVRRALATFFGFAAAYFVASAVCAPTFASVAISPEVIVLGSRQAVQISARFSTQLPLAVSVIELTDPFDTTRSPNAAPPSERKMVAAMKKQADGSYAATLDCDELTPRTRYFQVTARYGFLWPVVRTNGSDLRVGFTQRPITLPPDPGEAGKSTLEGIDSDKDGVRDDVEREILFMAPGSERLRLALRDLANGIGKQSTLENLTSGHQYELEQANASAVECISALGSLDRGDIQRRYRMDTALQSLIANTYARQQILAANYHSSGPHWLGDRSPTRCAFDPSQYSD